MAGRKHTALIFTAVSYFLLSYLLPFFAFATASSFSSPAVQERGGEQLSVFLYAFGDEKPQKFLADKEIFRTSGLFLDMVGDLGSEDNVKEISFPKDFVFSTGHSFTEALPLMRADFDTPDDDELYQNFIHPWFKNEVADSDDSLMFEMNRDTIKILDILRVDRVIRSFEKSMTAQLNAAFSSQPDFNRLFVKFVYILPPNLIENYVNSLSWVNENAILNLQLILACAKGHIEDGGPVERGFRSQHRGILYSLNDMKPEHQRFYFHRLQVTNLELARRIKDTNRLKWMIGQLGYLLGEFVWNGTLDSEEIGLLVTSCPNLRKIHILNHEISRSSYSFMISNLPKLKDVHVELHEFGDSDGPLCSRSIQNLRLKEEPFIENENYFNPIQFFNGDYATSLQSFSVEGDISLPESVQDVTVVCPNLESFEWTIPSISSTESVIKFLSLMRNCPHVTKLKLICEEEKLQTDENVVAAITENFTDLAHLSLINFGLNDEFAIRLIRKFQDSLISIDFSGNSYLTGAPMDEIGNLIGDRLISFNFGSNENLEDADFANYLIQKCYNLRELTLSGQYVTDELLPFLQEGGDLSEVNSLSFVSCGVTDESFSTYKFAGQDLWNLSILKNDNLSVDGIVGFLRNNGNQLKSLEIEFPVMDDYGNSDESYALFMTISSICQKNNNLTKLSIKNFTFDFDDAKNILTSCPNLTLGQLRVRSGRNFELQAKFKNIQFE